MIHSDSDPSRKRMEITMNNKGLAMVIEIGVADSGGRESSGGDMSIVLFWPLGVAHINVKVSQDSVRVKSHKEAAKGVYGPNDYDDFAVN